MLHVDDDNCFNAWNIVIVVTMDSGQFMWPQFNSLNKLLTVWRWEKLKGIGSSEAIVWCLLNLDQAQLTWQSQFKFEKKNCA